jgi:hypothetical protein
MDPTEPVLEQVHAEVFGAADRFAHLFHVAKVEVYKVAERPDALHPLRCRRPTEIDLALDPPRPQLGILAQEKGFTEVAAPAPNLHTPLAGREP